jgi:hypothetical protein
MQVQISALLEDQVFSAHWLEGNLSLAVGCCQELLISIVVKIQTLNN